MDELPAPMGGKDNTWRNLSLAGKFFISYQVLYLTDACDCGCDTDLIFRDLYICLRRSQVVL